MSAPGPHLDENVIAAFVQGGASPNVLRQVEEHIDGCLVCARLVSELAHVALSQAQPPERLDTSTQLETEPSIAPRDKRPADAEQLGRFRILHRLGQGGMGVVYAAHDPSLDRRVALKLLHAEAQDPLAERSQARLVREAQAMAKLAHPNVLAVYEVGQDRGQMFLALELVEGVTLTEWLSAQPRTWRQVLGVFQQAGRGLVAAHAAGLVHRDFKPDNVLIDRDGRVRVSDFGLAHRVFSQDTPTPATSPDSLDVTLTSGDGRVGTPRYMAPEQHRGEQQDARADQFSFCVALFEAVSGARPFNGSTPAALREQVLDGRITGALPARVPAPVRAAILRGLRPDPAQRHEDMQALLAALEDAARARLPRPLLAVSLAAVVLGTGAALWMIRSDPRPPPPVAVVEPAVPRELPAAPVIAAPPAPVAVLEPAKPEPPPVHRPAARTKRHPAPGAVADGPRPAQASAAPATLTLRTRPPATVRFASQELGVTPLQGAALPAGHHTLQLIGPEGRVYLLPVVLERGQELRIDVALDSLARAP